MDSAAPLEMVEPVSMPSMMPLDALAAGLQLGDSLSTSWGNLVPPSSLGLLLGEAKAAALRCCCMDGGGGGKGGQEVVDWAMAIIGMWLTGWLVG